MGKDVYPLPPPAPTPLFKRCGYELNGGRRCCKYVTFLGRNERGHWLVVCPAGHESIQLSFLIDRYFKVGIDGEDPGADEQIVSREDNKLVCPTCKTPLNRGAFGG